METKEDQETKSSVAEKIVEAPKVEEPKSEPVQPVMDEKMVESIADKLAEKINFKAEPTPAPVTTNEFSGEIKNSEEEVLDRLTSNLLKR